MKTSQIVTIVLAILLFLALAYIGYTQYAGWKQQTDVAIMQQGAQIGYEQAISQLYQGAAQCQQVPLTYRNQTINLIAVECLQQQAAQ